MQVEKMMSMALAAWLVVKQWSWLADDMVDDGMGWGTENRISQDKEDRIQGTVKIVEAASLGIEVLSLHVFVVFAPQIETDVVEQMVQECQQKVLDDDTWDKCEQVVSGADKYWVSVGWDLHHDEMYAGVCQVETAVLQVVHKEGEGSQQVQLLQAAEWFQGVLGKQEHVG